MTRSELLEKLVLDNPDFRASDIAELVDVLFEEIATQLKDGGRIELRGFGTFTVKQRNPKEGRNPRTGESVSIPAKRVPYFKPGKTLRERINKAGSK